MCLAARSSRLNFILRDWQHSSCSHISTCFCTRLPSFPMPQTQWKHLKLLATFNSLPNSSTAQAPALAVSNRACIQAAALDGRHGARGARPGCTVLVLGGGVAVAAVHEQRAQRALRVAVPRQEHLALEAGREPRQRPPPPRHLAQTQQKFTPWKTTRQGCHLSGAP